MTSGVVTEQFDVKNFDRVVFKCFGEMHITQGEEENLTITAHERILSQITCEVRSGTLYIDMNRRWFQLNDLDVYTHKVKFELGIRTMEELKFTGAGRVFMDALDTGKLYLSLKGAGDIRIQKLKAEEIEVGISGAGQIRLSGSVVDQEIKVTGAGEYRAPELESESATATVSGAGSIVVRTSDVLDAAITGLGSITYHGKPIVKKRITGLGSVNRA